MLSMNVFPVDYSSISTGNNSQNMASNFLILNNPIDKFQKKIKDEQKNGNPTLGWVVLGIAAIIAVIIKGDSIIKFNDLSKNLGEASRAELKKILKTYPGSDRSRLVKELSKTKAVEQSKPSEMIILITDIAKAKNIKSKSEETFEDKLKRWFDWI